MGPLAGSLHKLVQTPTILTIGLRFLVLRCQGMIDAGKTTTEAAKELGCNKRTLTDKIKHVALSWPPTKWKYKATAGAQT